MLVSRINSLSAIGALVPPKSFCFLPELNPLQLGLPFFLWCTNSPSSALNSKPSSLLICLVLLELSLQLDEKVEKVVGVTEVSLKLESYKNRIL